MNEVKKLSSKYRFPLRNNVFMETSNTYARITFTESQNKLVFKAFLRVSVTAFTIMRRTYGNTRFLHRKRDGNVTKSGPVLP